MSDGQNALISSRSYLAVGRETTWGTGVTCSGGNLDFISSSIKTTHDSKILEQISIKRGFAKRIGLGRKTEGDIEFYYRPADAACNYILENAFGATVAASIPEGYTASSAYLHTFVPGYMGATHSSLSINTRKGDATDGKVFEYTGGRVNEIVFTAEMDEALKCKASMIFKDATHTTNDIESALTISSAEVLSFVNARFSIAPTYGSLTSSSEWHVQSIEFGISNGLKSDNDVRRIGSDVLNALPVGSANFTLKVKMRFDTFTAYDYMLANTNFAAEAYFAADTLAAGVMYDLKVKWPKVYIKSASDPEMSGDDILTSEIEFDVVRDDSSAGGFAIKAEVTNLTASY